MEDTLFNLYCLVDDFCQAFYPQWEKHLLSHGLKKRAFIVSTGNRRMGKR